MFKIPIPKIKKEQFHSYAEPESGVFGLFDSEEEIIEAAEKAKEKKYQGFDCFTPYPVHGLDDAMGLARSGIPWVTFWMGAFGCIGGFLMQYTTYYDWPLNIAGKSLNAWPAYIPITFEFTIFMAGVSSFVAMMILAKLPKVGRKVLHPDITTDKFALWIPSSVPGYNEGEVEQFIKGLGSKHVEVVK